MAELVDVTDLNSKIEPFLVNLGSDCFQIQGNLGCKLYRQS
jgi:hypothetical protein